MPANDTQLPPQNNDFTDYWEVGCRWYNKCIPSAFAFGLSNTNFTNNSLNIQNNIVNYGDDIHVTINNRKGLDVLVLIVVKVLMLALCLHPKSFTISIRGLIQMILLGNL
jgi:hypothetical protein